MQGTNFSRYDKHLMSAQYIYEALLLRATNTLNTFSFALANLRRTEKPPETFNIICSGWTKVLVEKT